MKTYTILLLNTDWMITVLSVCGILLLVALIANLVYTVKMHRKNRLMKQTIDDLVSQHKVADQVSVTPQVLEEDDDQTQEDQNLFQRLDAQLDEGRLYSNPNINRDTLCQLIGVDKNRLGRIITRFSGATNSATYISRKRMQYAIELMREHPDWTMMHIAEACGVNNTSTFNRVFRQTYEMTPTEYMKKTRK